MYHDIFYRSIGRCDYRGYETNKSKGAESHQEAVESGYPMPGRSFIGGVEMKF